MISNCQKPDHFYKARFKAPIVSSFWGHWITQTTYHKGHMHFLSVHRWHRELKVKSMLQCWYQMKQFPLQRFWWFFQVCDCCLKLWPFQGGLLSQRDARPQCWGERRMRFCWIWGQVLWQFYTAGVFLGSFILLKVFVWQFYTAEGFLTAVLHPHNWITLDHCPRSVF